MPRTRVKRPKSKPAHEVRPRVGRVNQKMIDRMIKMRREGFSYVEIAKALGCSPRTVRRHTKGVSPQLVHAEDPTRVDLLQWGARQARAIQQHWRLSVGELDLVMKQLRSVISELDDMTIEQLELDRDLRVQFLMHEVWPPAHEKIDDLRLSWGIEGTREPLKVSGVTGTRRV
jgi:AraC-like DNA-binding protein